MSFLLATAIAVTVFLTSILSGIFGMAGGMIVMGLLAWSLPVPQAMMFHAVTQFFGNLSRLYFLRVHLNTKAYFYFVMGLTLVFFLFIMITFVPDKMVIFLLMGLSPMIRFVLPKRIVLDSRKASHVFICGALTSAFQMTSGVIGPLVDIFFQDPRIPRQENVANKALFQMTAHLYKFIYFSMIITPLDETMKGVSLLFCFVLIVLSVAGTFAGAEILNRMKDKHFYMGSWIMLLGISAVYLFKGGMMAIERYFY